MNELDSNNSNYYLFAGQPANFATPGIPQNYDDVFETIYDPYHSMIFGKKLDTGDFVPVIKNYNYVANTKYAKYNDSDPLLTEKQFYVVINADSYYHIFKCLDNHFDSYSTIPPNFADVDATDSVYRTSDGYAWKYMYSVSSILVTQFGSLDYIPYQANSLVQDAAIDGAIDIVEVLANGAGYSNYTNGVFSISDIRLNGNSIIYALSNSASLISNYYNGGILYIISDPNGNATGQYRKIEFYTVNATTKFVQLESPFAPSPQNGSQYQIYPGINIIGDGYQTINADAWAIVNASTNTIDRVEMLNRGEKYTFANAYVISSNTVPVSINAVIRPIYSPPGGHGANVLAELYCGVLAAGVQFNDTEGDTIPSNNRYQKIGILKNPLFANVELTLANSVGIFIVGETLHKINDPILLQANVTAYSNTFITGNNSDFENQLKINDFVHITNGAAFSQLLTVNSVINSSALYLNSNCEANSSSLSIYKINSYSNAIITNYISNIINITGVKNPFEINDYVIGELSGAIGYVADVQRNGISKTFSTFIQCFKYNISANNGIFTENELVYQTNTSTANALMFFSNSSVMLTTNQIGFFTTTANVIGANSGAEAALSQIYKPELKFGSGSVLFLQNFDPVERANTQYEAFKLFLSF